MRDAMVCPESQFTEPVSSGNLSQVQDSGAVPREVYLGHGSVFGTTGGVWAGLAAPLHLLLFTSCFQEQCEK